MLPRRADIGEVKRENGTVLFLSLYLLLLAAFILLNSFARVDEARSGAVIAGLHRVFANEAFGDSDRKELESAVDLPGGGAAFASRIINIARSTLDIGEVVHTKEDHTVEVRLPLAAAFDPALATPRPSLRPFLARVAQELARKDGRVAYELQILMPPAAAVEPSARDRATGLARALLERGVPMESLAAGTELASASGKIHFRFLTRERSARPDFSALSPQKAP
jgi:hypothetical protein